MTASSEPASPNVILVQKHLALWRERDPSVRLQQIREVYSERIQTIAAAEVIAGQEALNDYISLQQATFPGYHFRAARPVVAHHEAAMLNWQCGPETQPDLVTGADVFQIRNGKIELVTIFINE